MMKKEINSAGINENVTSVECVNKVENINSAKDVPEASKTSHDASLNKPKPKTKGKSKTGYMGLRKGFLL